MDTFEPEPEVDIVAAQKDIVRIEAELADTQEKMHKYLVELGLKQEVTEGTEEDR